MPAKLEDLTPTRKSLPISLLRTRELIMESVRPMLARHKVTEQQWRVLRVIAEEQQTDATTIADRACLLAPSVTRILRALHARQFIASSKDGEDARRTRLFLTPAGKEFIETIIPESLELFAQLRAIVGEQRWEQLVQLLVDIRADINQARLDTQTSAGLISNKTATNAKNSEIV